MKIEFGEAWNGMDGQYPNHESLRTQEDVCRLLEHIRLLHGISTKDWTGMPKYIKLFAEKCVYGAFTVRVEKGIHQRWRSGYRRANPPDPHITVSAKITIKRIFFHVMLSETGVNDAEYTWATVGLSYIGESHRGKTLERWPAVFRQDTTHIQVDHAKPELRRKLSVGCLPPPN